MRTFGATIFAASLMMGLAACESTTAPGDAATMHVEAQGDTGGDPSGTSSTQEMNTQSFSSGSAEGTVDFKARVWVRTNTNAWVELTQQTAKRATLDASGRQGAQSFITAYLNGQTRSYNRVRIEFEEVKANMNGGLQIGTGFITGTVRVDFGSGGKAVVERSIAVEAGARSTTTLLLDLNSSQWLNRADAQASTVSRADFESAVRVLVK